MLFSSWGHCEGCVEDLDGDDVVSTHDLLALFEGWGPTQFEFAVGQDDCRGMLAPGYPADFVVLSDDIARVPASKIDCIKVLATILGGDIKYCHSSLKL